MAAETTVGVFKRHIMHATNITPGEQRLVYGPLVLRDSNNSLEHYSLQHHLVVHMTLCFRES
uniref:Ubiquitin-like domain-containing protein n=1 Tax=Globisporangium ultimum (strain ATCC 200006 / CBS 805.95 / DAOM BR144) TaxID=431595 RepID=K3X4T6_GLOUD